MHNFFKPHIFCSLLIQLILDPYQVQDTDLDPYQVPDTGLDPYQVQDTDLEPYQALRIFDTFRSRAVKKSKINKMLCYTEDTVECRVNTIIPLP
jgi:hypothetical protein